MSGSSAAETSCKYCLCLMTVGGVFFHWDDQNQFPKLFDRAANSVEEPGLLYSSGRLMVFLWHLTAVFWSKRSVIGPATSLAELQVVKSQSSEVGKPRSSHEILMPTKIRPVCVHPLMTWVWFLCTLGLTGIGLRNNVCGALSGGMVMCRGTDAECYSYRLTSAVLQQSVMRWILIDLLLIIPLSFLFSIKKLHGSSLHCDERVILTTPRVAHNATLQYRTKPMLVCVITRPCGIKIHDSVPLQRLSKHNVAAPRQHTHQDTCAHTVTQRSSCRYYLLTQITPTPMLFCSLDSFFHHFLISFSSFIHQSAPSLSLWWLGFIPKAG